MSRADITNGWLAIPPSKHRHYYRDGVRLCAPGGQFLFGPGDLDHDHPANCYECRARLLREQVAAVIPSVGTRHAVSNSVPVGAVHEPPASSPEWSEVELACLDMLYPDFGAEYIVTRLTSRSIIQIRAKAAERGLVESPRVGAGFKPARAGCVAVS